MTTRRRHIAYTDAIMVSLSVVVPVYHNQETLRELHSRLVAMCSGIVPDAYELIFVNDGSTDRSWEVLSHIASTDIRVRAIALSRNFGSQAAILSGLAQATGERIAETPPTCRSHQSCCPTSTRHAMRVPRLPWHHGQRVEIRGSPGSSHGSSTPSCAALPCRKCRWADLTASSLRDASANCS